MKRPSRRLILVAAFILAGDAAAWAQRSEVLQEIDTGQGKPRWIDGAVPVEQRRDAREIFLAATDLLKEGFFAQAEAKFHQALELLDHPGIHYNLALAQLPQKKPIAADDHFERAMRFGPDPLGTDKYAHARNYRKLLRAQIAELEIACPVKGAEVSLNGKAILVGPGRYRSKVKVAEYQIVARKPGWLTDTRRVVLKPGKNQPIRVAPEMVVYRRPLSAWIPWSLIIAGSVVAGAGAALHWRAGDNFAALDRDLQRLCPQTGCHKDSQAALSIRLDRATLQQRTAIVAYVLGGLSLAAGLTMAYFNRPRASRVEAAVADSNVAVVPVFGPDASGVNLTFHF